MIQELPDYNPNGTANPKGDAAYWRARAEKAEAALKDIVNQSEVWGELTEIQGLDFVPPRHQILANVARKALAGGEGMSRGNTMVVCIICGLVYNKAIGHVCYSNDEIGTYVTLPSKPVEPGGLYVKIDEIITALRARAEQAEADAERLAAELRLEQNPGNTCEALRLHDALAETMAARNERR